MKLQQVPTVLRHFIAAKWRWHTLNRNRLTAYQDSRAHHIIAHARRHTPFYHTYWAEHADTEWRTLPAIDKAAMLAQFDQANRYGIDYRTAHCWAQAAEQQGCSRFALQPRSPMQSSQRANQQRANQQRASQQRANQQREEIIAGLSSGTSGERGLFLVTQREIAMWAGVILARALHNMPWRGCRVAFFLRAFSQLYSGVNSPLLQLAYFALTQPRDELIAQLNQLQPHIVIGPPSLLVRLAQARQQGLLRIAPNRLIAVAETLEPQDERLLHNTFGLPIHQIYQCTEGLLAVSCSHGSLHIQEDLVALQLEPILAPITATAHGPTVEPTRYTPIITDLWRTTQPIIRYRLGDLLQVSDRACPCGSAFRVITAIEGRVADIPHFTATGNPAIRIPIFPTRLRQIILDSSPAISDYQLVQTQDDQLQLYITIEPSASFAAVAQRVEAKLTAGIIAHGCQRPTLAITQGILAQPPTVKRRRVQRACR